MPFQLQKILDAGTSNPIVARLGPQTADLLKWLDAPEKIRDEIMSLYMMNLAEKLIHIEQIKDDLNRRMDEAISELSLREKYHMPFVMRLEPVSHDFLYQVKNYARDALLLFDIAFGKRFKEAKCLIDIKGTGKSEVYAWAEAKFGADSPIANLVSGDTLWIGEPIWMRNAVEHPGEKSGTLTIRNIRRMTPIGGPYMPPTWQRTGQPETSIVKDMATIIDNLLTFSEEAIAAIVITKCKFKFMQIFEIPEKKRDAEMPIRFRIEPNAEMQAKMFASRKP